MSPEEVLKLLKRIRFSPRAGRPVSLVFLSRQAGYSDRALFRVIRAGSITPAMARRLSQPLARLVATEGGTTPRPWAATGPTTPPAEGTARPREFELGQRPVNRLESRRMQHERARCRKPKVET